MKDADREALERLLRDLPDDDLPEVDLTAGVLQRIRATSTATEPRPHRRRGLLVAAVAATVLAACATIPPVRDALVSIFQVNGIRVRQAPSPAPTSASPSPSPSPAASLRPSPAASLPAMYEGLGDPTTEAEAEAYSSDRLLHPGALGVPDRVFRRDALVTLAYGKRAPTWLVMEVVAPSQLLMEKIVMSGAHVRRLTVNGQQAVWVEGPQELIYVPQGNQPQVEEPRLSGNSLIWEQDGVAVRIETTRGLAEALKVAESMR
jgi:hypothetical protein